jgi:hypothetical protein
MIIPAEVHSDDHVKEAKFDALAFFEGADDQEIIALAGCDWGGDYPADEVARECDDQPGVTDVLDWGANFKGRVGLESIGFECYVDGEAAMKWLRENKPALAAKIEE